MKPSVGRIVHYAYERDGETICLPAIVIEVPETVSNTDNAKGLALHLCVIKKEGILSLPDVWHSLNNAGRSWHWPERIEE